MLRVENISKRFNERIALDNISFELKPGEFTVLVGNNGAGKSTLLDIIAGDVRADAGRVAINGEDVTLLPGHRRARYIGRVFQEWTLATAPDLTVEENLAVAQKRGRRRTFVRALNEVTRRKFAEALSRVGLGLDDRLDARAGVLSGGQRQVLALLMATAPVPDVLLLDEHCSALDPVAAEVVARSTESLIAEFGITTLMVTHNLRHAITFGTRLIMMQDGLIRFDLAGADKEALTVRSMIERFGGIDYAL
jgi:putative ABC transport system ATP-binding protein